ncbi:MAG: DUF6516 family protein [bacterium]|nr:DUF6516 family protein [bacterium]
MPQNRESYQQLIYRIAELSKHIRYSDLVTIPVGKNLCVIKGNIYFNNSIRLKLKDALDFSLEEWITGYSYTVYQNEEKLYWYGSQGHPDDPDLQATHAHHKHTPPDIKHNRVPAPDIYFKEQNLTFLISEIEKQHF